MKLTARQLNRATLGRQVLLQREALAVSAAVRRVVALQAQEPASPYLALWNRLASFDPADLDTAFATQTVVKATLMRITLHAVHASDYQTFREAMDPSLRAFRLDARFVASGLTPADADAMLPDLLEHSRQPRTSAEMETWLAQRLGARPHPGAWRGFRGYAPLLHAPTGGPWSFGSRNAYIAATSLPALADTDASATALAALIVRYLAGFGPASIADVARFTTIQRARVKEAVQALAGELERVEGPDGEPLFDVPGAPYPEAETAAPPRLMAMWDSVLLAHADRGRVIPPEYRKLVIRANGDVLPTLLVDGYVAGVWRPVAGGIAATAFHPLSRDTWEGLAAEAQSLTAFLATREPEVYRRYAHWWGKLPVGEKRLLRNA
jgi:hypothetical protein